MSKTKVVKKRVWEIDFFRGLPIFGLLLYHFAFDITLIPTLFSNYWQVNNAGVISFVDLMYTILNAPCMEYLVRIFAGAFIFITGISCSFSRSNLKRGLQLLGLALALTAITAIASAVIDMDVIICMGILHLMGVTITFYGLIELICRKLNKTLPDWIPFLVGMLFIFVGVLIDRFYTPFDYPDFDIMNLPSIIFGFTASATDWFPIFPWSGVIFCGISIGKWFYSSKKSLLPQLDHRWHTPITFIGRHTLWIYVGHQIVYVAVLLAILLPMGYRF